MATALETANDRLAAYLAAEAAILAAGQEGTVGTRRRREAELTEIRKAIKELQQEVADLQSSGSEETRFYTVVPQ